MNALTGIHSSFSSRKLPTDRLYHSEGLDYSSMHLEKGKCLRHRSETISRQASIAKTILFQSRLQLMGGIAPRFDHQLFAIPLPDADLLVSYFQIDAGVIHP